MAAQQLAHRAAPRPMRAYSVNLRSAGGCMTYTALAHSSGEALCNALAAPELAPPMAASIKPLGSTADAMRVFRLKMALADLVEG